MERKRRHKRAAICRRRSRDGAEAMAEVGGGDEEAREKGEAINGRREAQNFLL